MLQFLRSESSLLAYSNIQELFAVANLFNINIHIFTYVGEDGTWSDVGPDLEMSSSAVMKGDQVPDLYLYHSRNSHYDLLVKDDSRLARMGLVGRAPEEGSNGEWKTFHSKSHKSKKNDNDERLLIDDEAKENELNKDMNEMEEEITLLRG